MRLGNILSFYHRLNGRGHYARALIFTCVLAVILLLYQINFVRSISQWLQNGRIDYQTIQPTDYQTIQPTAKRQFRSHHLTLIRDEEEFWNFLAAQLELHAGHHIEKLQTTENVIAIVRKYKSIVFEDVTLYNSQLENDTSASATRLLSSLSRVNTSLIRLFQETLYELKRIKDIKSFLPSQLSNETKIKLGLLHTNVAAMVQKLSSQINPQSMSKKLGRKIQEQIHLLQYPSSCSSAKKLLCGVCGDLVECGFGCTLHYVGLCMVTAYLSNRTMVLDCSGWKYTSRGWEAVFQPISNCTLEHIKSGFLSSIPEFQSESKLPELFNHKADETIRMRMPFSSKIEGAPPAVPEDLVNKILLFNDDPSSWWWGHFKLWAMRLKDEVARDIEEHLQTHNITKPVVGVHIRRSDKNTENNNTYHFLDEYMVYVAEWYDAYEIMHPNVQRKVYLATDEPAIIEEATTRYPTYEFLYDQKIVSSAAMSSRYNEQSLLGTLKDIHTLLRCDYVVCTISSTMCRLVYELAQAEYGGSHTFKSLDFTYFVFEGRPLFGFVRHNYSASRKNEVDVNKGQAVIILENHWDGYLNIQNLNRTMAGLVPAFTIERLFDVYNYSSNLKVNK